MFKTRLAGFLSTVQFFFLLAKGLAVIAGIDLPWLVVLFPFWTLLFIAVVFWGLFGLLLSKFH